MGGVCGKSRPPRTRSLSQYQENEMQDGSFMKITFNDDDDDNDGEYSCGKKKDDADDDDSEEMPQSPIAEKRVDHTDDLNTETDSNMTYTNVDRLGVTHVYERDVETVYIPPSLEEGSPEPETTDPGIQLSKCPQCEKTFARKDSLKRHLRSHIGAMSYCEACNRQFWTAAELRSHIAVKHQGERFICNICSRQYQTKYGLKLHIDEHNKTYRFVCSYCNKGFNYRSQYEGHMHGHEGLKPFKCTKCNKSYSQSSHLSLHKKVCGLLGKKFACPQCGKTFKLPKYLKEHQKIHSEPSKLTCPVCGVILSCGGALHNHITRQHPEEPRVPKPRGPKVNPMEPIVKADEPKINPTKLKINHDHLKIHEEPETNVNKLKVELDTADENISEMKIKTEPPDDD